MSRRRGRISDWLLPLGFLGTVGAIGAVVICAPAIGQLSWWTQFWLYLAGIIIPTGLAVWLGMWGIRNDPGDEAWREKIRSEMGEY